MFRNNFILRCFQAAFLTTGKLWIYMLVFNTGSAFSQFNSSLPDSGLQVGIRSGAAWSALKDEMFSAQPSVNQLLGIGFQALLHHRRWAHQFSGASLFSSKTYRAAQPELQQQIIFAAYEATRNIYSLEKLHLKFNVGGSLSYLYSSRDYAKIINANKAVETGYFLGAVVNATGRLPLGTRHKVRFSTAFVFPFFGLLTSSVTPEVIGFPAGGRQVSAPLRAGDNRFYAFTYQAGVQYAFGGQHTLAAGYELFYLQNEVFRLTRQHMQQAYISYNYLLPFKPRN